VYRIRKQKKKAVRAQQRAVEPLMKGTTGDVSSGD
jgi:hypothetical protein